MKGIKRVFTLLLVVIFTTSCSSDGNADSSIYQKWYCTEVIEFGHSDVYNSNICNGFYIEFYELNKFRVVGTDNCHEVLFSEGTFIKQGNSITTNGINLSNSSQFSTTYEVTELSQHSLTLTKADYYYPSETGELLPGLVLKYNQ